MFEQGDDPGSQNTEIQPESNNRTFKMVAGIMAGLILISIICMAVYFLVIAPGQQSRRLAEQATVEAYNMQIQQAMTQTAAAGQWTHTLQPSPESSSTPTRTPVLAGETTTQTVDPLTATMAYWRTQVALLQGTPTVTITGTIFAMPQGGIADDMKLGLPALIITAFVLVIVILLARRLRKSPVK